MSGGELLTYGTVRAAVLLYVASILLQLPGRRRLGRWAWTVGCALLWLHVAAAMHFVYAWDHGLMVRETARQTGEVTGVYWGGGVYFNYAFMLVWLADAGWWWAAGDERYRRRAVWVAMIVHAFLAFIAFNAVVVFARGPVRWGGVMAVVAVVATAWRTRKRERVATADVAA